MSLLGDLGFGGYMGDAGGWLMNNPVRNGGQRMMLSFFVKLQKDTI